MLFTTSTISDVGQLADASLRSLPWSGLVIVGAVGLVGLAMWALGGRLARPMYGLLFGAVGASGGLFTPAAVGLNINPYLSVGAGAILGMLAGLLLFRLSMATALAAVGGTLAPLIVGAVIWLNPGLSGPAGGGPSQPLSKQEMLLPGVPIESTGDERAGDGPSEPGLTETLFGQDKDHERHASSNNNSADSDGPSLRVASSLAHSAKDRLGSFIGELASEAGAGWSKLPTGQQLALAISAALGALGGFLLGMSFPKKVASVGSAFLGAGVWTPIAAKAMYDFSVPGRGLLPGSARGWLALWLFVAAAGLILQWTVLKRNADRPVRSAS